MKSMGHRGMINRRDFCRLGTAGAMGITLAGIPQIGQSAEKEPNPPEVFMMFPGNYTWSSSARNLISSIPWGGGAMGEIYKVCAALMGRVGDNKAWFVEWNRMGEKVAALGEGAESHGHPQTASGAFMRAAQYIQVGERQLQPRTPESQKAYAKSVELFKRGSPNLRCLSVKPVEVPFEGGKSLPAYFVKMNEAKIKLPTVVFFDGFDITKEIQYFKGVPELAKRGVACLIVDGPGNGESIRFRGMPARYDSNVAGSAAIDYLETREDVDKDHIGVMGISLGGYFAPRCAAFEKRFKACVSWGGSYNFPKRFANALKGNARNMSLSVPPEHNTWFFGVDNIDEAIKKAELFTPKGIASKIECAFLVVHGEGDKQSPLEDAQMLYSEVGSKDKTLKVFTKEEGGSEHCQGDNLTIGMAYIADWFADKLQAR